MSNSYAPMGDFLTDVASVEKAEKASARESWIRAIQRENKCGRRRALGLLTAKQWRAKMGLPTIEVK
jgi:hypothetical protein